MKIHSRYHGTSAAITPIVLALVIVSSSVAQQTGAVVPTLVNYSGTLTDGTNKPLTGTVGVTFSLYKEQEGGSPLWVETQNVQLNKAGQYSVVLGSAQSTGLPANLFAAGEARWLGVQAQGQAEQPRVLLLSVPYALKALDAETIGGKPASAFVLAPTAGSKSAPQAPSPTSNITGSGTADFLPMFTGTTTIGNSKVYQNASGDIGIGTTSPAATLDVKGKGNVRDTLTLFPKSTDPVLKLNGAAFQVNNKGVVTFVSGQTFPGTGTVTSVGSGAGLTGGPITNSGTLSIANNGVANSMLQNSSLTVTANSPLSGGGSVALGGSTSLGLANCSANQILQFVSGAWTCENAPTGTITGVTAGTDLTGGGSSGNVTVNLDTTKVPQLATANTFTAEQVINIGGTTPSLSINSTGGAAGVYSLAVGAGIFGETTSATAYGGVEGWDGSTAGNGTGVYGYSPSGMGVSGVSPNNIGVSGTTTNGTGVLGTSTGGVGVSGVSSGNNAVQGFAHTNNGSGVAGFNDAQDATGVYGSNQNGYGFVTDSHVSQGRSMGGWVKALAYINGTSGILRCFNSTLPGSQASTPPCGMTFFYYGPGKYDLDFGFQVDDRFVMVTPTVSSVYMCLDDQCSVDADQAYIYIPPGGDFPFFVAVY